MLVGKDRQTYFKDFISIEIENLKSRYCTHLFVFSLCKLKQFQN